MAEYRRFVAYIYEYVNGIKGENVGFVKVESRNGICRIQLHLQSVPKEETSLQVDGFVRTQNHVGVIPLGICRVNGNIAEFKGNTPHRNFGNSDYTLDQIAGMFLEGENGSVFATAWDNEPVDVDELKRFAKNVHMKQKASEGNKQTPEAGKAARGEKVLEFKDSMEKQAGKAENSAVLEENEEVSADAGFQMEENSEAAVPAAVEPVQEQLQETADAREVKEAEDSRQAEASIAAGAEVREASIAAGAVVREASIAAEGEVREASIGAESEVREASIGAAQEVHEASIEAAQAQEVREASIDAEKDKLSGGDLDGESLQSASEEVFSESVEAVGPDDSVKNVSELKAVDAEDNNGQNNSSTHTGGAATGAGSRNNSTAYARNNVRNNGQPNTGSQVHMTQTRGRQPANGRCNMNCGNSGLDRKWEHFQCHYPAMEPFTDDEIVECIQIAPKDIMFLRRDDQRFARNNFLLQSYYNYQHLLLGRLREGGYILGVPGLYENQERFMANMFGFMNFKEARPGKQENFGYWLRPVR